MAVLASIDIGTNSVKLLVLDVLEDGRYKVLFDQPVTTQLGKGAGEDGRLAESAMQETASRKASHTEIASINGGSPTALERKIVDAGFGASSRRLTLNTGGTSRLPGIL